MQYTVDRILYATYIYKQIRKMDNNDLHLYCVVNVESKECRLHVNIDFVKGIMLNRFELRILIYVHKLFEHKLCGIPYIWTA